MKEIVIAGGGLAGLSLGIALRERGVPVTLREASTYPRHRVCGEFVNGVTEDTLANLGVLPIFHDALRLSSMRWWMRDRQILEASIPRPALGMSRWVMDERLRLRFEKLGGVLRMNDRVKFADAEGLVWSAGRRLRKDSHLVGLKAHFEEVEIEGFLEMHVGERAYIGLTPVSADGKRINVCGLFEMKEGGGGGNPILKQLRLSGLEALADRLTEGRMDQKSLTGISGLELGRQQGEQVGCSLGDSGQMIPPFTGNGMSMAFESAECALPHVLRFSEGGMSWGDTKTLVRDSLEKRFSKRMGLALKLHRCLWSPFGRSALSSAATAGVLPFHWLHQRLS